MGAGANLIKVALSIPRPRLWDLEAPCFIRFRYACLTVPGRCWTPRNVSSAMPPSGRTLTPYPVAGCSSTDGKSDCGGQTRWVFEQQDVVPERLPATRGGHLLAKICNMNFLRLTQRPVQPEVYDYCDRLG